ncbi:MAG: anti-sigma factor antagonist [Clostridia bacterium]|nr:anti-sigma factor antagonist [Clostridia bacterium]
MANENILKLELNGRIDSGNSESVAENLFAKLNEAQPEALVLDAENLEYISSAGLRVILRINRSYPDLKIINVSSDVYEILEMTGFTEMMTVEKAYRRVSVEGCEVIGEGFNGKVYRIDKDNVVKTYKNADALAEIQHEREVARLALILGVPTAISYDVVKVGDSYGSVFELLNAKSFAKILAKEPERMDFCVEEYVKMLKKIHAIKVPAGKLPSIKETTAKKIERMKDLLPDGLGEKFFEMVKAIPESENMVHGDFHTKNIVLAGDEVLLIDMDTLSVGDPIFEFLHMYCAYVGYSEYNPEIVLQFQGYSAEISRTFWRKTLEAYFGTDDKKVIDAIEDKIRCISYGYLIDWKTRHPGDDQAENEATIALWKERLIEVLGRLDSLDLNLIAIETSDPNVLEIDASVEKLQDVLDFLNAKLEAADCSAKVRMQVNIAVEEIFVNIANYAYAPEVGKAAIKVDLSGESPTLTVTLIDSGIPYDPTGKTDPDITLSAEERQIGGLGIFMTKKIMDDVSYERKDGKNILTMKKTL